MIVVLAAGLGTSIGLLYIFINMVKYGSFTIYEPCTAWLYCEVGLIVFTIILISVAIVKKVRR